MLVAAVANPSYSDSRYTPTPTPKARTTPIAELRSEQFFGEYHTTTEPVTGKACTTFTPVISERTAGMASVVMIVFGAVRYVDALLDGGVPAEAIVIGALGINTLTLAGDKTLGAHPYLTVPAHTRYAREALGSSAFLAPEHKVVLTEDDEKARRMGRPAVQNPYLGLRNYTNNLMRHGFTEADVDGSGSDALIDALVAHGSPETIYTQINDHLAAGANHIGIQVFEEDPAASPVQAFRALAEQRPAH